MESEEAKRALLQFKLQNNKLKKDLSSLKENHADTEKQLEDSKNETDSLVQKVGWFYLVYFHLLFFYVTYPTIFYAILAYSAILYVLIVFRILLYRFLLFTITSKVLSVYY